MGQRVLRYDKDTVERTARLVENHMYDRDGKTKEGKLRLFIARNLDILDDLALLMRADKLGTGKVTEEELGENRLLALRDRMVAEGVPFSLQDLEISGADLTDLGYEGAAVGEFLADVHRRCVLEPHLNTREWLMAYAQKRLTA